MKSYRLCDLVLRYVVPFRYAAAFGKAVETAEGSDLFQRSEIGKNERESDLYSYIKDEFGFLMPNANEGIPSKKSGYSWFFSEGCKGKKLYYLTGGKKKDEGTSSKTPEDHTDEILKEGNYLEIRISDGGLYLFENGLGFIWYEITVPVSSNAMGDTAALIQFQNVIKEINRDIPAVVWEDSKKEGFLLKRTKNSAKPVYGEPFSFGMWICQLLKDLSVTYFAERRSAYKNMLKNTEKKYLKEKNMPEELFVGKDMAEGKVPDKPILFEYVLMEQEEDTAENRHTAVYHLTNGYNENYLCRSSVSETMKFPFENVIWNATKEGVGYFAWTDGKYENIFKSTIKSKIRTDYFTLLIKVLYQSYSLLIYAERAQTEIFYQKEVLCDEIPKLNEDINYFLARSMATSVSHIHHQNEFYIYLKDALKIHEDVQSVTSGLEAISRLQKEQEHEKEEKNANLTQAFLGVVACFAIITAFTEYPFLARNIKTLMYQNNVLQYGSREIGIFGIVIFGVIIIVSGFSVIFAIKSVFRSLKDCFKKKKKK